MIIELDKVVLLCVCCVYWSVNVFVVDMNDIFLEKIFILWGYCDCCDVKVYEIVVCEFVEEIGWFFDSVFIYKLLFML